jgi:arylsulfatase A-like enzyme
VPLVVIDPRRSTPRRVPDLVRSIDLAPTLCALAGVAPPPGMDGRSLAPALDGQPLPPALAFAETGLWFTEQIPDVPRALRIPYPDLTRLLEIHASHGDDLSVRPELEPLTIAAKHRMVKDDRYKLVYAPTRTGARYFLYDTHEDPGETRDVSKDHPEVVSRLELELWRWMLEDRNMERRGELLVPRATAQSSPARERGLRVEDVER